MVAGSNPVFPTEELNRNVGLLHFDSSSLAKRAESSRFESCLPDLMSANSDVIFALYVFRIICAVRTPVKLEKKISTNIFYCLFKLF